MLQPKGNSQFLLSPLELRYQPRPGLREPRPGQPTAGQTCPRKVPAVTTSALPHNATKIQGSCPQRSSEALELSQDRLEALLPSHRSIRREIATSGHARYWEGIPGFLREPIFCGKTMYPTWPPEELCAMLGQRVWDPLLLLYPIPSGDCLWQSRLVLLSRLQQKKQEQWEKAVNSIGFSHSSCKAWRTINKHTGRSGCSTRLCLVSANSIALQLVKNRGTQDWRPWAYQARQQGAVRLMEDSNTWGSQHLQNFQAERVCCCPQTPKARKISGIGFHLQGVYTPHQVGSQILVQRLPQFLHVPTQNSEDLQKSTM